MSATTNQVRHVFKTRGRKLPSLRDGKMLYLIGFPGDVVKVGRSCNVQNRFATHCSKSAVKPLWFHVFASKKSGDAENYAKLYLGLVSEQVGRTEVFSGVTRDIALKACRAAIDSQRQFDEVGYCFYDFPGNIKKTQAPKGAQ